MLFPPDANLEGGHGVVIVHNNMNPQINDNWDPLRGGMFHKLVPCENKGSGVVVCVEKGHGLLAHDK